MLEGSLHSCCQLQCSSAVYITAVLEVRLSLFKQYLKQTNKTQKPLTKPLQKAKKPQTQKDQPKRKKTPTTKTTRKPKPKPCEGMVRAGRYSQNQNCELQTGSGCQSSFPMCLKGSLGLLDRMNQEVNGAVLFVQFGLSQLLIRAELSREAFVLLDQQLQPRH